MTDASYVARNSNPISAMPLSEHARTVLPQILILLLWTGQTALGQPTQPLYQDSLFTVETSETRPNGIATGPFEQFVYFNTISHGWGTGNKSEGCRLVSPWRRLPVYF